MAAHCYVYAIRDGESVVYVGKGSGRRIDVQRRAFGLSGDILQECKTDTLAFRAEREWIARLKPEMNKCAGGNGGRVQRRRAVRREAWERAFDQIGSRRYCALLLLGCERSAPGIVDPSKLEGIRQVAHGCRS